MTKTPDALFPPAADVAVQRVLFYYLRHTSATLLLANVEDIQAAIDEMRGLVYAVVQSGRQFDVDGDGAFAYFDTVDVLGCMLEVIESPRQLPDPTRWCPAPPD